MSNITLKVNGAAHTVNVEPLTPLLYILRNDLGLRGPRFGCGLGQCGACTVIATAPPAQTSGLRRLTNVAFSSAASTVIVAAR